jgi:excisionase family DNA binding protein
MVPQRLADKVQAGVDMHAVVSEGFVDVPEAGKRLSLSRTKIYDLMDSGELPYARFGRARRIPIRALHEYAEKQLVRR